MQKSNPASEYDWAIMPQTYFLVAKMLCTKLKDSADSIQQAIVQQQKRTEKIRSSYDSELHKSLPQGIKILESSPYINGSIFAEYEFPGHQNYYLIFPIVFNLKHGLEIFIKGLGVFDFEGYKKLHDIQSLLGILVDKATTNNKVLFKKLVSEIWPVVKKYYYGTYIPSNTNELHPDKNNEAERYPERLLAYKVPPPIDFVCESLISNILDDLNFLQTKLRDVMFKVDKIAKDLKLV